MSATGGRLGLLTDIFGKFGGRRASVLASMADADPKLAQALDAALASDTPNRAVAQLMADKNIGKALEAALLADARRAAQPATTDQVMEGLGFERPRTNDQIIRDAVLGEGPYGESMMPGFGEPSQESVRQIHNELLRLPDSQPDSLGALAERMGQSGPRPLYTDVVSNSRPQYSFDLPNNTSPAFQISDLTPSQRSVMNPRRPAEPDLMDAVRANFENQAAGMDADITSLAADISRRAPEPDINRMGMDEGGFLGWPDGAPRRPEAPSPARGDDFTQRVADGRSRPADPGGWPSYDQKAVARAVDAGAAQRGVPRDGDFRLDAGQRRPGFHARNVAKGVAERLPPAVAGGLAAGLGVRLAMEPGNLGDSETMGAEPATSEATADLAAEQNPPPSVMTQEPPALSPRDQAMEMIAELNRMRREAGGEVPEAPAMQKEINRLLGQSNQAAAAASQGAVAVGGGPREQAQTLLSQLNAMRRQAGGEVPQAQQILREVARLNALSDRQTNARTTAFPR